MTAPPLTEAEFQQRVIDTARLHHWRIAHFRPAPTRSGRWSTPMQGDRGWPDLVLAKPGRLIIAELKTDHGKLGPGQQDWLTVLAPHAQLWRPADWEAIHYQIKETS